MSDCPRCKKCQNPLLSDDELEYGVCDECADAAYEQSQERRDFEYWHKEE